MHFVQYYVLLCLFNARLVLNLLVIFHKISGSYSYNIVLIKTSVVLFNGNFKFRSVYMKVFRPCAETFLTLSRFQYQNFLKTFLGKIFDSRSFTNAH